MIDRKYTFRAFAPNGWTKTSARPPRIDCRASAIAWNGPWTGVQILFSNGEGESLRQLAFRMEREEARAFAQRILAACDSEVFSLPHRF